ncbi:MAG: carbon starvation protein A, partial [Planctomycetota bacterium]
ALFVGCVHDFSALVLSARHGGTSIGSVAEGLLGKRSMALFHGIIFFGVSLAMGVFVIAISGLFSYSAYPQAILPSVGLMLVAGSIGLLLHRGKVALGPAAGVGFVVLLALIVVSVRLDRFGLEPADWPAPRTLKLSLLGYGFAASVLPVWSLLQPRDFINSLLLYLGLIAMYVGFFVSGRDFAAPAVAALAPGAPPMLPFVFITIACGAASGFHALVSSGTTAKQLDRETHARPIGYGGMLGESILGLLTVVACTAGVVSPEAWNTGIYASWESIKGPGVALGNFISGGASFLGELGLGQELARPFVAVVVVSFALTTLDSATRLLRYNVEEIAASAGLKLGRYASSALAVGAISVFCFYEVSVELPGPDGVPMLVQREAGMTLWQLFGTTNQLLAALTLLLATRYLARRGRWAFVTGVPMVLMLISTLVAMSANLVTFVGSGQVLLAVVGGVLLLLALWLTLEGVLAWRRDRRAA